jgi:hypothetical protein
LKSAFEINMEHASRYTKREVTGSMHVLRLHKRTVGGKSGSLTKISAVKPLTSLLGGGAAGNSLTSKKGFRDILFCVVSKLRGEVLRRPGDTARLRKGLLEDRLTDKVAVSRVAVFGEGRRASTGFKKCQWLWRRWAEWRRMVRRWVGQYE